MKVLLDLLILFICRLVGLVKDTSVTNFEFKFQTVGYRIHAKMIMEGKKNSLRNFQIKIFLHTGNVIALLVGKNFTW